MARTHKLTQRFHALLKHQGISRLERALKRPRNYFYQVINRQSG